MGTLLMPKATAIWLVENTSLTFEQIAAFSGLHPLEIQALADDELASIKGLDPITAGQLTAEEIRRCEENPSARLELREVISGVKQPKKSRYIPLSKRQDKPNAISWLLKNHPELGDAQIMRLLGTTKNTIQAIRTRSHRDMESIRAENPVAMGLCAQKDLDSALAEVRKKEK